MVIVDSKPTIKLNTTNNKTVSDDFILQVTVTDDKALAKIGGVLTTVNNSYVSNIIDDNTVSGTSLTKNYMINVSGLADGDYKISLMSYDNNSQTSSLVYYYFTKITPVVSTPTTITNFSISEVDSGDGKVKLRFDVDSDYSISSIKAYCSTSSSFSTSSSYYQEVTSTASTGTKIVYLTNSNWAGDKVYCRAEVKDSKNNIVQSDIINRQMSQDDVPQATISNFDIVEVGEGEGKIKATYNISSQGYLSIVRLHCSDDYAGGRSSSYNYKSADGALSTGNGSIIITNTDWINEKVYCKLEVTAPQASPSTSGSALESVMLSNVPAIIPTEAPILKEPANGGVVTDTTPKYRWGSVANVDHYRVWIYGLDGERIVTGRYESGTSEEYGSMDRLTVGKTYEWYVKACNVNNECGPESTKFRFSVE